MGPEKHFLIIKKVVFLSVCETLLWKCKRWKRAQRSSCPTPSFYGRRSRKKTPCSQGHIRSDNCYQNQGLLSPHSVTCLLQSGLLIPARWLHLLVYLLPCGFSLVNFNVLHCHHLFRTLLADPPTLQANMCSDKKQAYFNTNTSTCFEFEADLAN